MSVLLSYGKRRCMSFYELLRESWTDYFKLTVVL
nr:MAG TPA: hypothetical protein [Caudoviricetes sp.]